MRLYVIYLGELSTVWVQLHLLFRSIRLTCTTVSWAAMTGHPQGLGLAWILQNRKWWRPWFHWQFFFISIQFVCLPYCKVAWINTSQLDAQVRVYRLLMKRKFDAYLFTAIFSGKVYLLLYMLLLATLPYMISILKKYFLEKVIYKNFEPFCFLIDCMLLRRDCIETSLNFITVLLTIPPNKLSWCNRSHWLHKYREWCLEFKEEWQTNFRSSSLT